MGREGRREEKREGGRTGGREVGREEGGWVVFCFSIENLRIIARQYCNSMLWNYSVAKDYFPSTEEGPVGYFLPSSKPR